MSVTQETAVLNVIAKVASLGDQGDVEDWLACFADDAVVEGGTHPILQPAPAETRVRRGRSEIEAAERAKRARGVTGPGSNSLHHVGTPWVTVDGNEATATATWAFYRNTNGVPELASVGRYRFELRMVDGDWKVCRRAVTFG